MKSAPKSETKKKLLADDATTELAAADEPKVVKAPSTPTRNANRGAAEDASTPAKAQSSKKAAESSSKSKKALFGNASSGCVDEVLQMYKIVNKCTGSLGGNGSGGAIYGGIF